MAAQPSARNTARVFAGPGRVALGPALGREEVSVLVFYR